MIEMEPHNGLRGVAALWVCVYHCFLYSTVNINLLGSTLMPLFFILSGYSLAVVYGAKPLPPPPSSCCCQIESGKVGAPTEDLKLKPFNYWQFQQNRFARVLPGYYAGLALSLPQWYCGYGFFSQNQTVPIIISIIVNVIPIVSLFTPVVGIFVYPIDAPTWTISTFLIMWFFFPRWLAHAQQLDDMQLLRDIVIFYWVQHLIVYAIFFPITILGGPYLWWPGFSSATMSPFSRLPVFLMGVYAGVLCLRNPDTKAPMPWPRSFIGLPFISQCCELDKVDEEAWAKKATGSSLGLLAATLGLIAVQLVIQFLVGPVDIGANVWLQAWVAYEQLTVAVALTRDTGVRSWASRVLRLPVWQRLGQLSMSIYIIHWPIIFYLSWALHGGTNQPPATMECSGYDVSSSAYEDCSAAIGKWQFTQLVPVWGVVVILPLSIVMGWLVYRYVEEPGRKLLRAKGGSISMRAASPG